MKSHIADMNDWYLNRRSYSSIRAFGGNVPTGSNLTAWDTNATTGRACIKGGRVSCVVTTGMASTESRVVRLSGGESNLKLPLTFFAGSAAAGTEKSVTFSIPDGWFNQTTGNDVVVEAHTTHATGVYRASGYLMGDENPPDITGLETPNRLKGDKANARKFSSSFKWGTVTIGTGVQSATIWTPASGRTIRVKGFRAVGVVLGTVGTHDITMAAAGQVQLGDDAIGTSLLPIWSYGAGAIASGTGFVVEHDLGDGVSLSAADNVLKLGTSSAYSSGTGTIYMECAVWGAEI